MIASAPGLDHGVDLLDLALGVGAGDLGLKVDLVAIGSARGHRLDHVGGLGLPVVADVAHAEEDLELLGRGGGRRGAGKACRGSGHGQRTGDCMLQSDFHFIPPIRRACAGSIVNHAPVTQPELHGSS